MSVSQDGALRTWLLKAGKLQATLALGAGVSRLHLHAHSMLAALACADLTVRVVDVERACVVRRFRGHKDRITDVAVSPDAKWVLSAGLDGTLRVWDVPSATCLQAMAMGAPVTALSLSPGMELLATAHVGQRGISLWSNRLLFSGSDGACAVPRLAWLHGNMRPSGPSLWTRPSPCCVRRRPWLVVDRSRPAGGVTPSEAVVEVRLPSVSTGHAAAGAGDEHGVEAVDASARIDWGWGGRIETGACFESSEDEGVSSGMEDSDAEASAATQVMQLDAEAAGREERYRHADATGAPAPLGTGLLTLSGEAASKWESLVHLDAIKVRAASC